MNEAELIKEIVAEEARKKQEATQLAGKDKEGKPIFKGSVTPKSAEPIRAPETAAIVAKQVGLGRRDTYRKAEKVWNKAQAGDEKAKQVVKALDKDEATINKAYKDIIRGKERTDGFPKLWDIWKFKNEAELINEIVAEEARKKQEATRLISKGIQKKDTMARQNSDEPLRTDESVAKQVGPGAQGPGKEMFHSRNIIFGLIRARRD